MTWEMSSCIFLRKPFLYILIGLQVEKVDMKLRYAFVYMPAKDAKIAVASVRGDDKVPPPLSPSLSLTLSLSYSVSLVLSLVYSLSLTLSLAVSRLLSRPLLPPPSRSLPLSLSLSLPLSLSLSCSLPSQSLSLALSLSLSLSLSHSLFLSLACSLSLSRARARSCSLPRYDRASIHKPAAFCLPHIRTYMHIHMLNAHTCIYIHTYSKKICMRIHINAMRHGPLLQIHMYKLQYTYTSVFCTIQHSWCTNYSTLMVRQLFNAHVLLLARDYIVLLLVNAHGVPTIQRPCSTIQRSRYRRVIN
jgi:hypothetical protein